MLFRKDIADTFKLVLGLIKLPLQQIKHLGISKLLLFFK